MSSSDKTKLDGIESGADVTDTANVTAAGALMDSEVTNLDQVKAFSSSDYATAAQGTKADSAQQPLLRVLLKMVIKQSWMELKVGLMSLTQLMLLPQEHGPSEVADLDQVKAFSSSDYATAAQGTKADLLAQQPPTEGAFEDGDKTKLDGIESGADVTDTANVTAAGALMDSEVTNLDQVKAFTTSDHATTAAQGTKADSAQQPPTGAFEDGDKTKLDGIESGANVTDTAMSQQREH